MGAEVVVEEQFDEGQGQVGLRVRRDYPHLLQQFLDRVVGLCDLVVPAVDY